MILNLHHCYWREEEKKTEKNGEWFIFLMFFQNTIIFPWIFSISESKEIKNSKYTQWTQIVTKSIRSKLMTNFTETLFEINMCILANEITVYPYFISLTFQLDHKLVKFYSFRLIIHFPTFVIQKEPVESNSNIFSLKWHVKLYIQYLFYPIFYQYHIPL